MIGAIASFLGLLGSLFSWFTGAQQRKIGAETQALKDDQATIQQATDARKIDAGVATDSDSDVDKRLSEFARKPE
jgi:hypothetical protein